MSYDIYGNPLPEDPIVRGFKTAQLWQSWEEQGRRNFTPNPSPSYSKPKSSDDGGSSWDFGTSSSSSGAGTSSWSGSSYSSSGSSYSAPHRERTQEEQEAIDTALAALALCFLLPIRFAYDLIISPYTITRYVHQRILRRIWDKTGDYKLAKRRATLYTAAAATVTATAFTALTATVTYTAEVERQRQAGLAKTYPALSVAINKPTSSVSVMNMYTASATNKQTAQNMAAQKCRAAGHRNCEIVAISDLGMPDCFKLSLAPKTRVDALPKIQLTPLYNNGVRNSRPFDVNCTKSIHETQWAASCTTGTAFFCNHPAPLEEIVKLIKAPDAPAMPPETSRPAPAIVQKPENAPAAPALNDQFLVTASALNLRAEPAANAPVKGVLERGSCVTVTAGARGSFVKVITVDANAQNGLVTGYVANDYLAPRHSAENRPCYAEFNSR